VFGKVTAQCIDQLRSLPDEKVPGSKQHGSRLLHFALHGYEAAFLVSIAPSSQELEPPAKPERFKIKTSPAVIELIDKLLDEHLFSEIADILNVQGFRPGSVARRDQRDACFTTKRVTYLVRQYKLKSRYDRLRERGMLTKKEAAARLNIHEQTLVRWVEFGLVTSHAYNGHHDLYELPEADLPQKHCSRWDTLVDRVAAREKAFTAAKTLTYDHKDDAV
jgi:hypothetical protein